MLKAAIISAIFVVLFSTVSVFADQVQSQSAITPINDSIGIEKTIVPFHAPKDNKLPWGYVEGKVTNPVEGYPVIIQFFKDGEPVQFAQVDVSDNGDYQYKFRVRDVTDNKVTNIFEGDYTVKIFKVVYLDNVATSSL